MGTSERLKTAQDRIDERVLRVIDPYANDRLHAFADSDGELMKIERLLETLTFDSSDVPWYIEWGALDELNINNKRGGGEPWKPDMLNSIDFRRKLRTFMSSARRIARRVGYCAYYVFDDDYIANWVKDYLVANAYEQSRMPAPFGIIPPSESIIVECQLEARELAGAGARLPTSRLEVEWYPRTSSSKQQQQQQEEKRKGEIAPPGVKTSVFTAVQLSLVYPSSDDTNAYHEAALKAHTLSPIMERVRERFGDGVNGGDGSIPFVLPNSPILDVMRLKARLNEAIRNRAQAEGVLIQPNILLNVDRTRLNKEDLQLLSGEDMAVTEDTTMALLANLSQQQLYSEEEWEQRRASLDQAIHPRGLYPDDAPSSSQFTRLLYGRPHPLENIHRFTEGIKVAHVHKPMTLVDVDALDEQYRQAVAEACGLSLAILQQFTGGGGRERERADNFGSMYASPHETPAERHLSHIIQTERNWISEFFDNVYTNMMYALDMRELQNIYDHLHEVRLNMRDAKLAARALETLLSREISGSLAGAAEKYVTAKETAGSKEERKEVRMKIGRFRALLNRLRVRHDTLARIVFQPGTTKRTAQLLQILLTNFYPLGLVTAKTIERFAKPVFGDDFEVEENPEPPLLAVPGLSPADELKADVTKEVASSKLSSAPGGVKRKKKSSSDTNPKKAKRPRSDS